MKLRKNVLFIPPRVLGMLTQPEMFHVLRENKDSVLVIEDAENIVIDRGFSNSPVISTILNIADGLLSDYLNIQTICTFNVPLSQVDSALLRKGRLIAKYEFKELDSDKAQKLSDKLGYKRIIDKPMSLADIYYQDEMSFGVDKGRYKIGFNS